MAEKREAQTLTGEPTPTFLKLIQLVSETLNNSEIMATVTYLIHGDHVQLLGKSH